MKLNIDLHIHSPYAAAVSKNMSTPVLAREAKLKGLDLIGTGIYYTQNGLNIVKKT